MTQPLKLTPLASESETSGGCAHGKIN